MAVAGIAEIGDTVVKCVAADAGGNTANASFVVTVLGAKEQLARLIQEVVDATSLPAAVKTQLIATLQRSSPTSTRTIRSSAKAPVSC